MDLKLIEGIETTAGIGNFEGHNFSSKLTLLTFVSKLNRYVSYASLVVTHSLLNDSKCIGSMLCSNYCPFKNADIPGPL